MLDDRAVSRHHLTLRVEAAGLRVLDAGSRNGTILDGISVRDAYARPDSNIAVGSLSRIPNGSDTDDASADWAFTTTPTPGAARVSPLMMP